MTAQKDIVFGITADTLKLVRSVLDGKSAIEELQGAAAALDAQLKKAEKGNDSFGFSAKRMADQMDKMRQSYDPAYAATKRYEAAVAKVEKAHERNVISAAQYRDMLDGLAQKYRQTDAAAETMATGMTQVARASQGGAGGLQNVGFQIQDFAVQVGAGTSATQAFAQQLPQLASGFGPVGIAIGTLSAVAIPLLAVALGNAGEAAKSFDETLSDLEESIRQVSEVASTYSGSGLEDLRQKYGEITADILSLVEAQRILAESQAISDAIATAKALRTEYETGIFSLQYGYEKLADDIGATDSQAGQLLITLGQMSRASTLEEMSQFAAQLRKEFESYVDTTKPMNEAQQKLYQQIVDMESAMRQLVKTAPDAGWLSGMISEAQTLGKSLWDAVRAKNAATGEGPGGASPNMTTGSASWAQNSLGFTLPGPELLPPTAGGSGTGTGGGSRVDPMQARIEALVQSLKTEDEITAEWYATSLEALNAASEAELAAIGGKHSAIERLEQEHQDRLGSIREMGNQWGVQAALEGGAAILGAMASTNKQAQKAQSIFAAASALMSTYQGAAKELEKGTFGFASAAAVIAKGIGFIAAIKSAGSGGGGGGGGRSAGGGGSSAAPVQQQSSGTYLNFQFNGGWTSTEDMGRFMVKAINQAVENGAQIRGARIV